MSINLKNKSVFHDPGSDSTCRSTASEEGWLLSLFHFENRRWADHPVSLILYLIRLILFILFAVLHILLNTLHDVASILISFFDFLGLDFKIVGAEVGSFAKLINIGYFFFAEKELSEVLKNRLYVLIVEPKNSCLSCLHILYDPNG